MPHYVKLSLLAPANSMALRWPGGQRAQERGRGWVSDMDGEDTLGGGANNKQRSQW